MIHNERTKLRAKFISNIGVGLIIIGLVLPILPHATYSSWTLGGVLAGLLVAGLGCIGVAHWLLDRQAEE